MPASGPADEPHPREGDPAHGTPRRDGRVTARCKAGYATYSILLVMDAGCG